MNSNNYYSVAVSNCLSEFESLFTKNKFISKKVFDKILDKYQDVFEMFNSNRALLSLDKQNKTMKITSWVMTIMIILMGFTLPSALGVYWLAGAIFSIIQSLIMHFVFVKKAKKGKL